MRVYLVERYDLDDGYDIVKIFASYEKARKYADMEDDGHGHYVVDEWEVEE